VEAYGVHIIIKYKSQKIELIYVYGYTNSVTRLSFDLPPYNQGLTLYLYYENAGNPTPSIKKQIFTFEFL